MRIRLSINGPFVPPAGSITDVELRLRSPPACTSQANSETGLELRRAIRRDPMIQEIGFAPSHRWRRPFARDQHAGVPCCTRSAGTVNPSGGRAASLHVG